MEPFVKPYSNSFWHVEGLLPALRESFSLSANRITFDSFLACTPRPMDNRTEYPPKIEFDAIDTHTQSHDLKLKTLNRRERFLCAQPSTPWSYSTTHIVPSPSHTAMHRAEISWPRRRPRARVAARRRP